MKMNIDKRAISEDGGLFRNPSHIDEADRADDQQGIYRSIREAKAKREVVKFKFINKKERTKFPGIYDIKNMNQDALKGLFRTILRSYPNIIGIQLRLGNYPGAKMYSGRALNWLNTAERRFTDELAEMFAELFYNNNIVEVRYFVDIATPAEFRSSAEATTTTDEEYANNELFNPILAIEYIRP